MVETLIVILAIWNFLLTGVVLYFATRIKNFAADINKGDLIKMLDKIVVNGGNHSKQIKDIEKEILKIQSDAKLYIQKVALMRFNPFDDLGGDHSFALALLDRDDNGIIMSGLHTRERTRIYVKNISGGKSTLELSKEEAKVLKQAIAN